MCRAEPLRILLIDDSPHVRKRVRDLIVEACETAALAEAGTVSAGLRLLVTDKPHLAIVDLHLPDGSGYRIVGEAKHLDPRCTVVVLSSNLTPEGEARCRELGADFVFEKSTQFEDLVACVLALEREAAADRTLLANALAVAAVPAVITDRAGTIRWCNQAWCELTGYPSEEAIGRNPRILKSGLHDDAFYRGMWNTILAGEVWRGEIVNRRRDGSLYDEEETITPLLDRFGVVSHFLAIKQEITERRRTGDELRESREALRRSEERLRLALAAAEQGMYDLNVVTGDAEVTPEYATMLGYDPARFRETNAAWIERLHPDDQGPVAAAYRDYIAGRTHEYRVEFRQKAADGDWKWVLSLGRVVERDAAGQPLRMLGTHTDITARKHAEIALEQEVSRRRILFERATDGLVVTDHLGSVIECNSAFAAMLGYTPAEAAQLVSWQWDLGYASSGAVVREGDEQPRISARQFRRKDGTTVDVEVSCNPADWAGQRLLLQVCRDVTDRAKAAAERERLQMQLLQAQKMESVGRLAGGVAHDFNNMLSVILGRAELLLDGSTLSRSVRADLQEIKSAALRSADLTRQLLAFSRQQPIAPRLLDLNQAVEGMLKMLRRLIGEDIELVWVPGADVWPVRLDPAQIDQILANLAVNARDAIAGIGQLSLHTRNVVADAAYCTDRSGLVPGEYVMLSVSDDGCGMDATVRERLFEPFFTTKAAGHGTGLGLATVYGIVKQNHGYISVYSEPGTGATFRIYLPRDQGALPSEAVVTSVAPLGKGETVLLVEDEPAILRLGRVILESLGYEVLTAPTPDAALTELVRYDGEVQLLVTDVVMPAMNGRELAKRVKKHRPKVRCLFMSGYPADVIAHRGTLHDGLHFIAKPFSRHDFARKVREVLDA